MLSIGVGLLLLLVLARLAEQVVREEFLLVMRWPGHGWFLFEMVRDGRYRMISPARVPLTAARFVGHLAARAVGAVQTRPHAVRSRGQGHSAAVQA